MALAPLPCYQILLGLLSPLMETLPTLWSKVAAEFVPLLSRLWQSPRWLGAELVDLPTAVAPMRSFFPLL